MAWRIASTIRCGVIIDMGRVQVPAAASEQHRYIQAVRLERPRLVKGWRTTPAAEYDVDLPLSVAGSEEARKVGLSCLGEVVAALSFLGSAPVEVVNVGITDSPAGKPEALHEYTTIFLPEFFKGEIPPTKVPAAHAGFLLKRKPERVVRALRWVQKSHFANNPVDEFTFLMIALEAVSDLLKGPGVQHWRCRNCDREVVTCPLCGASTESKKSGETAMREFVASLGWPSKEWKAVWRWRCKIVHGDADISIDEEHAIRQRLPKVEEAVMMAVKTLTGLPPDHSPKHVRHRLPFSDPQLEVKWHV
jgi:hypothetical protein